MTESNGATKSVEAEAEAESLSAAERDVEPVINAVMAYIRAATSAEEGGERLAFLAGCVAAVCIYVDRCTDGDVTAFDILGIVTTKASGAIARHQDGEEARGRA